jgi:hypothetical protein
MVLQTETLCLRQRGLREPHEGLQGQGGPQHGVEENGVSEHLQLASPLHDVRRVASPKKLFRGDGGNTVLRVLLAQLAVQPLEVLHVPREGDLQHQYAFSKKCQYNNSKKCQCSKNEFSQKNQYNKNDFSKKCQYSQNESSKK